MRRYLATQPAFGESARLFVVRVPGGPIVTNEPELVARDDRDRAGESIQQRAREATDASRIRTAPLGYATFDLTEAGSLRLLTRPIVRSGRTVAMLSVGETLASVQRAQQGVIKALLLAGSLTLVAAILLGAALAARIVQPLRRMARTAARVDAGDLAPRIHAQGPPDEIRVLADAFDHMLDRLEDAFAAQRAFVADASHELRTPLTVIRGQLEVLSRQAAPSAEDVRRTERIARIELVRMERLVDDLLLLARADEGALVHAQDIELEPFVRDFFESLTTTADRRFELAGEAGGTLQADPDRLAQALHNLARNAIQHTTEGGLVRLRVTARQDQVELAVEDDGPGIPESERTRVFDRFHRAETRRRSGSGLGLSIVSAIAAAHRGSVNASSSRREAPAWQLCCPAGGPRPRLGPRTPRFRSATLDEGGVRAGGGAARGVR